ncbi:MAG: xanthine dehydrogenase family protein molybdopterin-binding subunit [Ilumatobacter sp.]
MRAAELDDLTEAGVERVGRPIPRVDAVDKVTGRARYSADISLPGQLVGVIVRSERPHAAIASIDTNAACAIEGVAAVMTGADVSEYAWYEDDEPLLPRVGDIVRFVGDDVAVVVAETESIARRAASVVEVRYDDLEPLTDVEHVDDDDAPMLLGNDEIETEEEGRGDVETAFTRADLLVEGVFHTPTAVHNAMEPHGAVADWRGEQVDVYTSTQGINDVREHLAERLGIDHSQVRVICEYMGGGFGAKQVPWKPTMLAVVASKLTGAPVKVMNDRRSENLAAGKRNATVQRVRIGAMKNGSIVAIDAEIDAEVGAYSVPGEASAVHGPYLFLYQCDDVRVRTRRLRSNLGPAVAFRGPGYLESTFVLESLMDELAVELGIDPIDLRRRNHAGRNQQEDVAWSHPDGILRSYERVAEESGWANSFDRQASERIRRGRGFAAHDWVAAGAMPPGHATVEFNFDGSVHVGLSAQDLGTGTRTVLSQVVADAMGVDLSHIRLSLGDTSTGPPAPTSAGSATVPTMAPAVRAAALAAVDDLLDAAAEHLGVDRSTLSFDGSNVSSTVADVPDQPLTDLCADLSPRVVHGWGSKEATPDDVSPRAQGSAEAEVEVDLDTGAVRGTRIGVGPDCGRILNRRLADSQVLGGVTQGIGFALTERQFVDHHLGTVMNPDLNEYLLPTASDTCEIVHAVLDIPDLAANEVGAKGIGELPLLPVPAAIANAVHDAIGIRFRDLPITRKRVLDALTARDTSTRNDEQESS